MVDSKITEFGFCPGSAIIRRATDHTSRRGGASPAGGNEPSASHRRRLDSERSGGELLLRVMPIRRTASIGGHSPGSGRETPAEEGSLSPAGSRRVSRQSSRSNLGAADGPDEARGNKVVPEVEETAQSRSISKIIKVRARRSPARSLGAIKIVVRSTPRAATSAVLVDRPR